MGSASATCSTGYETTSERIKYRMNPPRLSYRKPSSRMIGLLTRATTANSATIKPIPTRAMPMSGFLSLPFKKSTSLAFYDTLRIAQEYELFCIKIPLSLS